MCAANDPLPAVILAGGKDSVAFAAAGENPRRGLAEIHGRPMIGYVVDALFVAERVIVELDSKEFHMDPIAFEADRERDAEMLLHGFVTVRVTWERIEQRPRREAERLHAILAAHAPRAA